MYQIRIVNARINKPYTLTFNNSAQFNKFKSKIAKFDEIVVFDDQTIIGTETYRTAISRLIEDDEQLKLKYLMGEHALNKRRK